VPGKPTDRRHQNNVTGSHSLTKSSSKARNRKCTAAVHKKNYRQPVQNILCGGLTQI